MSFESRPVNEEGPLFGLVKAIRELRENPGKYPGSDYISRRIDQLCQEAGVQTDEEWWEFTDNVIEEVVEEAHQLYDKSSFHPELAGYETFEEWEKKHFG